MWPGKYLSFISIILSDSSLELDEAKGGEVVYSPKKTEENVDKKIWTAAGYD